MAFPTVITSSGFVLPKQRSFNGPFLSSAGNVYVLLYVESGFVHMYKATNPESSFSEVGTPPGGAVSNFVNWVVQDGDDLYIATGYANGNYILNRFFMSTDTWDSDINNEVIATQTLRTGEIQAISIVKRSDGSFVAFFPSTGETLMGVARGRVSYATSSDGITWGSPVDVGGTGVKRHIDGAVCVLGASDRVHMFYEGGTGTSNYNHRSLSSGNTLDTAQSVYTSSILLHGFTRPLAYVSGLNTVVKAVLYDNTVTKLGSAFLNSEAFPAIGVNAEFTTGTVGQANSSSAGIVASALHGTTVHHLWVGASDLHLYRDSQPNGGNFGTDIDVMNWGGTIYAINISANIYTRAGAVVIGLVYQLTNGSTNIEYTEIVLVAASSRPFSPRRTMGARGILKRASYA